MNYRHSKIAVRHLLANFNHLLLSISINHSLLDIYVFVEVNQRLKFVLLVLNRHIVLVNTFQGKLLFID